MFRDDDQCPCASGSLVRDCLCKYRRFVPRPVCTEPRGLITGISVAGCYASATRNCTPPLTREHLISRTALNYFAKGRLSVGVSNHPWQRQKDWVQGVGISGISATVLCARHNSALGELDAWARSFIEALDLWSVHIPSEAPGDFHRLFSGYDLERWLLKVLCAHLAGGRWRSWAATSTWRPPRLWLDILFSGVPFPPRCGLYLLRTPTKYWRPESSIYIRPVFGTRSFSDSPGLPIISPMSEQVLVGIEISLFGFQVLLCTVPIRTGFLPREALYRPRLHRRFALQGPKRESAIHLGWDEHPPTFARRTYPGFRTDSHTSQTDSPAMQRIEAAARSKKCTIPR